MQEGHTYTYTRACVCVYVFRIRIYNRVRIFIINLFIDGWIVKFELCAQYKKI